METAPRARVANARLVADRAGRALISDLRDDLTVWNGQLARYQTLANIGRPVGVDLPSLLREMENARRRLLTELQDKGHAVKASGPVSNLLRSLERAISSARELSGAS